jgi:hypothetical protein
VIPNDCKRLAEMDFPIAKVSRHAAREKSIRDPVRFDWHEVTKVAHYYLAVSAMTKPMQVRENSPPYGGES